MKNLLGYEPYDLSQELDGKSITSEVQRLLVSQFLNDGFIVVPPTDDFLECVAEADSSFQRFKQKNASITKPAEDESGALRRIVNLHCAYPEMAGLFCKNPALSFLDILLGEATLYTSLFFEKGSSQDIHRDTPYFWTSPGYSYLGVWVALENTDKDNGPLRVVRGGNKIPELDRDKIWKEFFNSVDDIDPYSMDLWNKYQNLLVETYSNLGLAAEEVHVEKGSTIIWHPQTPHGGSVILDSNRTRKSIAMHVTAPNKPVFHQDKFFTNAQVPDYQEFSYDSICGRRFIQHGVVSFGHKADYPISEII